MPVHYRPHTAAVAAVSPTVVGSEITAYSYGAPTDIRGQLTEKSPEQALQGWGIELNFPAVWLCDLADAGSIKVGDRLTLNSRLYVVVAGPQKMDAEPVTAHARYLLERQS